MLLGLVLLQTIGSTIIERVPVLKQNKRWLRLLVFVSFLGLCLWEFIHIFAQNPEGAMAFSGLIIGPYISGLLLLVSGWVGEREAMLAYFRSKQGGAAIGVAMLATGTFLSLTQGVLFAFFSFTLFVSFYVFLVREFGISR